MDTIIDSNAPGIWCIHGNLQRASAWEPLQRHLPFPLEPVDLYASTPAGFMEWTRAFCDQVRQAAANRRPYLMGYSLGGRLALHTLLHDPGIWRGVIIIAADPGLASPQAREQQLARDKAWGTRFETEDWRALLNDWNAQRIFCGRPNSVLPQESDFDRTRIAEVFDRFSKGRQDNLVPLLTMTNLPPTLYISGQADEKYTEIGRRLAEAIPSIRHIPIAEAGHRVPWEAPEAFAETVCRFIDTCESRTDPCG